MTAHDDMPRDPALSQRYREAGEAARAAAGAGMAPPPALDAHILAAAHAALQTRPAPSILHARPWWRRLLLPAGAMATAMFAVMLSLTVQRQTPETTKHEAMESKAPAGPAAPRSGTPAAASPDTAAQSQPLPAAKRAAEAVPAPATPAARGAGTPPAVERKSAPQALPRTVPAVPAATPARDAAPAPAALQEAREQPEAAKSPPPAASNEADAATSRRQEAPTADHARESQGLLRLQKAAPAPAAAAARSGATADETAVAQQAWIEEIRELRRQGRDEEAARRLAELRNKYPGLALPEDLRR